jgi:hypothetical protein
MAIGQPEELRGRLRLLGHAASIGPKVSSFNEPEARLCW